MAWDPKRCSILQRKGFSGIIENSYEFGRNRDLEKIEGKGALNFLAIDDLLVCSWRVRTIEPKQCHPADSLSVTNLIFPKMALSVTDPFLKLIQSSQKKWVVITDASGEPKTTLNTDSFLRAALFDGPRFKPLDYCHHPIIIKDEHAMLGDAIPILKVYPERFDDDVIDKDIILFWGHQKRIITGSDILGRLMRGIVHNQGAGFKKILRKEA